MKCNPRVRVAGKQPRRTVAWRL